MKKALDLEGRHQIDDGRAPSPIELLALAQDLHDLWDVTQRTLAIDNVLRNIFCEHFLQRLLEVVGCEEKRNRTREHFDMLGRLLDLAHALEIADCRRNILDADAEQA